MALIPGTRLGPYEILAPLGQGGMGEVYKARDTRLDRTVAIKVLPEALASDPTFRDRFDREAKAIAALQHPHICTLYDVGQERLRPAGGASRRDADGDASGGGVPASPEEVGINYLVLEYLDGQTLAERLTRSALPIEQALTYAIQIADALDKAHRAGIVHRDLKPGNVMVTKGGMKLLDFGLAKASGPPTGTPLSMAPTAAPGLTAQGTILGTFQYMAPEQLEGKDADARTDIFAFGAVVYEMVTGKKAFEGTSQASLIGAIMNSEPTPIAALQPMSPPALDRIIKTCLAKAPDDRWQGAGDLCRELKWVAEGGSRASVPVPVVAERKGPLSNARLAWAVAALAAVFLLGLSMPAMVHLRETPVAAPEMRLEINTPSTSEPISFALSPDGRQIVFVASGDGPSRLWLRRLDASEAQPLAATEGARFPFWSPDSRSVGFFAGTELKRLDLGSGSPQVLVNMRGSTGRGGAWSPDGTILFGQSSSDPLFRIPVSGGEPVAVTRLDNQVGHYFPQFLPSGRQFLFYARGTPDTTGLYLSSLDSSQTTRLGAADSAGAYVPGGWVLFIRGTALLAQRLDLVRGALTGEPVTVTDTVGFDATSFAAAFSVSAAGLVAYRSRTATRQLSWFDRSGRAMGTLGAEDNGLDAPRLSPDGRTAAVARTVQGNQDIWLVDATRTTRVTFDAGPDHFPVWSPDGGHLVFDSTRKGPRDLYLTASNDAGREEPLLQTPQDKGASDWSRDGRFLLYHSVDPQTGVFDIWALPMAGDRTPYPWLRTPFDERRGQFSPDGRWVAYMSNESGRWEIYVRPFSGDSFRAPVGQWQVSTAGGISPRWRSDGKELYYVAPDDRLMAATTTPNGSTFELGTPVALFQMRILGGGTDVSRNTQYDVARDGRFLINTVLDDANAPITLLQNWHPELAR